MAKNREFFTSESVTEGHPDKMADQISDGILDAILAQDTNARVACETLVTTGLVHVVGEISTSCYVDIPKIIRETVRDIGYTRAKYGDQGLMFGYATNETEEYMPLPISLAHRLSRQLTKVRKDGTLTYLRPDGKTQVTVEYDDGKPVHVDTIVISAQHSPEVTREQIEKDLIEFVIKPVLADGLFDENTKLFINPTGRFVIGGPQGDAGLTGRKIIVDTYGGMARHGGGAFSGKDPTKVDRSAAYAARYVAKNIVAAGLADKCELQLAYAIGVAHPVSIKPKSFAKKPVYNFLYSGETVSGLPLFRSLYDCSCHH